MATKTVFSWLQLQSGVLWLLRGSEYLGGYGSMCCCRLILKKLSGQKGGEGVSSKMTKHVFLFE